MPELTLERLRNAGQRFTDRLVDYVQTLRLGPGLASDTDIGPLIGDRYRQKVAEQVDEARAGRAY